MYIIAGLGNPGKEYGNTRHNAGYEAVDALAEKYNISVLDLKHKALIGKGMICGQKVALVKPLTFMNLSGESLRMAVDYYKVDHISMDCPAQCLHSHSTHFGCPAQDVFNIERTFVCLQKQAVIGYQLHRFIGIMLSQREIESLLQ